MNLNFDMLGSPNHAKFVYDGDFSDTPAPATAPDVNPGAAEIEKTFNDYFASVGIAPDPSAFDGRSDYKAFQDNGKPAGGLFSGAEVPKTDAQAAKWGGIPGRAFDPNYHGAGDTIDNVDLVGYEQMADAGAFVTGTYATRTLNAGGGAAAAKARSLRSSGRRAARSGSARTCSARRMPSGRGGAAAPPHGATGALPFWSCASAGRSPHRSWPSPWSADAPALTSATVPPRNCGPLTVANRHYIIKADQLRCTTAKTSAKNYLVSHRKPRGFTLPELHGLEDDVPLQQGHPGLLRDPPLRSAR